MAGIGPGGRASGFDRTGQYILFSGLSFRRLRIPRHVGLPYSSVATPPPLFVHNVHYRVNFRQRVWLFPMISTETKYSQLRFDWERASRLTRTQKLPMKL